MSVELSPLRALLIRDLGCAVASFVLHFLFFIVVPSEGDDAE